MLGVSPWRVPVQTAPARPTDARPRTAGHPRPLGAILLAIILSAAFWAGLIWLL